MTVAASDASDTRAPFSNFGKCVDLYAPGVKIISSHLRGSREASGTSMASPHVAGVAALVQSRHENLDSLQVDLLVIEMAAEERVVDNVPGTPNLLLNKADL